MVDVTIESAVLEDGKLTVTGTGFTRTTTTVEIDGEEKSFEIPAEVTDGSKLTVADVPEGAGEVTVSKGEITQSASITSDVEGEATAAGGSGGDAPSASGGAPESPYPDQPTEDDDLADATPQQLTEVEKARTAQNPDPVELGTYQSKEHLGDRNIQEAVAGTKLDRIEEEWGIGPRDPYPTGNPQDPAASRKRMGLEPVDDDETTPNPGAA